MSKPPCVPICYNRRAKGVAGSDAKGCAMTAENPQGKKFLGLDSGVIAVSGLFIAILGVVIVLATFAFNTLRSDIARVEAGISELRAETGRLDLKIDSSTNRLDAKIDRVDDKLSDKIDRVDARLSDKIDGVDARLSDKIDDLADSVDSRLDEVEREQSRQQGAFDALNQIDR